MEFPIALVKNSNFIIFPNPAPFTSGEGDDIVQHPSAAWQFWTDDDWHEKCPDLRRVSVIDSLPQDLDATVERRPEAEWVLSDTALTVTYHVTPLPAETIAVRAGQAAAERQRRYADVVQRVLDNGVRPYGYDGILSACTYATSTIARFRAEGQASVAWRDAVWSKCYAVLAEVEAGTRQEPTVDELLAELPTLEWPT